MKLYYSPNSPFVRKVRMASQILGLEKEIELVPVNVYESNNYHRINPLVKIPALITREGVTLTNSPFILEYLDAHSLKSKIFPQQGPERWQALQMQSIADGMMEASVLRRYEMLKPVDKRDPAFDQRQKDKVKNALAYFESVPYSWASDWTVVELSLASALGYLELRFSSEKWLDSYPRLNTWYQKAKSSPLMKSTAPQI